MVLDEMSVNKMALCLNTINAMSVGEVDVDKMAWGLNLPSDSQIFLLRVSSNFKKLVLSRKKVFKKSFKTQGGKAFGIKTTSMNKKRSLFGVTKLFCCVIMFYE